MIYIKAYIRYTCGLCGIIWKSFFCITGKLRNSMQGGPILMMLFQYQKVGGSEGNELIKEERFIH